MRRRQLVAIALTLFVFVGAVGAGQYTGTGTLTVEGESHTFDVSVCTFHGQQALPVKMLSGRGTDANGMLLFNVEMIANETADTAEHSAQVMFVGGRHLITQYKREAGSWTRMEEPAQGPLVRVEESSVVVEGIFTTPAEEEYTVVVEVDCVH